MFDIKKLKEKAKKAVPVVADIAVFFAPYVIVTGLGVGYMIYAIRKDQQMYDSYLAQLEDVAEKHGAAYGNENGYWFFLPKDLAENETPTE